jgi:hypothetical protein
MAIFTRVNGDAYGARNVDAGRIIGANTNIINTGIAAPLVAYKVTFQTVGSIGGGANVAAELTTGGGVETVLRIIEGNASVLAYQVDAGASGAQQLSVLAERSGWTDSTVQSAIRQTTAGDGLGNIGLAGNLWVGNATVTSTGGIKLS